MTLLRLVDTQVLIRVTMGICFGLTAAVVMGLVRF